MMPAASQGQSVRQFRPRWRWRHRAVGPYRCGAGGRPRTGRSDPFQARSARQQAVWPWRLRYERLCRRGAGAGAGNRKSKTARGPSISPSPMTRKWAVSASPACWKILKARRHQAGAGDCRRTHPDENRGRPQRRRQAGHHLPWPRASLQRPGKRRQCRDDGGRIRQAMLDDGVGRAARRSAIRVSIPPHSTVQATVMCRRHRR